MYSHAAGTARIDMARPLCETCDRGIDMQAPARGRCGYAGGLFRELRAISRSPKCIIYCHDATTNCVLLFLLQPFGHRDVRVGVCVSSPKDDIASHGTCAQQKVSTGP